MKLGKDHSRLRFLDRPSEQASKQANERRQQDKKMRRRRVEQASDKASGVILFSRSTRRGAARPDTGGGWTHALYPLSFTHSVPYDPLVE